MAASTNPFTVQGTLLFPPDEGQAQVSIPFGLSNQFTSVLDTRLNMTGAGTTAVPFGSVANAKLLLVEYEAAAGAAAINLNVNGGTDDLEISPGGMLLLASPTPQAGWASLSIVRTTDAVVRVRLLG
jgi:hypothetical protein